MAREADKRSVRGDGLYAIFLEADCHTFVSFRH